LKNDFEFISDMYRAANSVLQNIAEVYGRQSIRIKPGFANFQKETPPSQKGNYLPVK